MPVVMYQAGNQSAVATIITTNDGTDSSSSNHHEYDRTSVAVVAVCAGNDVYEREMPEEAMIAKWAFEDSLEDIMEWEVDRSDWSKNRRSASKPGAEQRSRSPPIIGICSSIHCPPEVPVKTDLTKQFVPVLSKREDGFRWAYFYV